MSESATPICDLIERLLSQGQNGKCPVGHVGQAMEVARPIEAALTRGSGSTEQKREKERKRKAAYRARKGRMSRGTKTPVYILKEVDDSQVEVKKGSKKESSANVPRDKRDRASDDWPDDYLDIFWKQYPQGRKTGKKAVAAKLARIRKTGEVTFATMMLGVSRYAASNPDPKYTKAPEVWLNKGCWDDEHFKGGLFDEANRGGNSKLGFSGIAARLRRQLEAEAGPAPDDLEPINGR